MKTVLLIIFLLPSICLAGWDYYFNNNDPSFNPINSIYQTCGSLLSSINKKYSSIYPNSWAAYACSNDSPINNTLIYWRHKNGSTGTWSVIKHYEIAGENNPTSIDKEKVKSFFNTAYFYTLYLFLIAFGAGAIIKMLKR